jgi:hypothetical protein
MMDLIARERARKEHGVFTSATSVFVATVGSRQWRPRGSRARKPVRVFFEREMRLLRYSLAVPSFMVQL